MGQALYYGGEPKLAVLLVSQTLFWIGFVLSLFGIIVFWAVNNDNRGKQALGIAGMIMEGGSLIFYVPGLYAYCMGGYPCLGPTRQTTEDLRTVPGPGGLSGKKCGCSSRGITVGSIVMFALSIFFLIGMITSFASDVQYHY